MPCRTAAAPHTPAARQLVELDLIRFDMNLTNSEFSSIGPPGIPLKMCKHCYRTEKGVGLQSDGNTTALLSLGVPWLLVWNPEYAEEPEPDEARADGEGD